VRTPVGVRVDRFGSEGDYSGREIITPSNSPFMAESGPYQPTSLPVVWRGRHTLAEAITATG